MPAPGLPAYQSQIDVLHVLSRIIILDLASSPVLSLYPEDLILFDCVALQKTLNKLSPCAAMTQGP